MRQVHMYLSGYTDKELKQFNHTKKKNQNQSYPSAPIIYGDKKKMRHNHLQRRYLTKKERNSSNRSMKIFISRKSRRQHTAMPNQCHHITIRESNRRDNEENIPTFGLHRDTRGRSNYIHQQQHEIGSPQ